MKHIKLIVVVGMLCGATACEAVSKSGQGLQTMGTDLEHSAEKHKSY